MRDREASICDLPDEILQHIANFMAPELLLVARSSWSGFFHAIDATYLNARQDLQAKIKHLLIKKTLRGIHQYLTHDKKPPGFEVESNVFAGGGFTAFVGVGFFPFVNFSLVNPTINTAREETSIVRYDKGYHRAHCLKHILNTSEIATDLRILAIYAVLIEKNGTQLKSRITKELKSLVPWLGHWTKQHFNLGYRKKLTQRLLKIIHEDTKDFYCRNNLYQNEYASRIWITHLMDLSIFLSSSIRLHP